MRLTVTMLSLVVLGLLTASTAGQGTDKPRRLGRDVFMRVKLSSSSKALEGIVTRDFELVGEAAKEMHEMSSASNWPRAQDETYENYSVEFRRLCDKMSKLAKEQNVDGLSFTYFQLTNSCITCHEYKSRALKRSPDPKSPFQLIPNAPLGRGK